MNKTEFINLVAKNAGITKAAATVAVSATFNTIKDALAEGEKVRIPGFGSFDVHVRAAHNAINPKTHEKVEVPESKCIKFTVSKTLKDSL